MIKRLITIALLLLVVSPATIEVEKESQMNHKTIIDGKTNINDIDYNISCECTDPPSSAPADAEYCMPRNLKIEEQRSIKEQQIDKTTIQDIIGDLKELKYVNFRETSLGCIDGRNKQSVIGAFGGDSGEFILALYVYEKMTRELTYEMVDSYFKQYLTYMSQEKFTMCTDDDALHHLETETDISINFSILKNPRQQDIVELLEALQQADNVGCRHIKSMLKNPDEYQVRKELIQYFIKSYYNILWGQDQVLKDKLDLQNFIGLPEEQAFVHINTSEVCINSSSVPLLKSNIKQENGKTVQIFVNHYDAVMSKREDLVQFFIENVNKQQQQLDAKSMKMRMNKNGMMFLEYTGSKLAKNLPFYEVDLV